MIITNLKPALRRTCTLLAGTVLGLALLAGPAAATLADVSPQDNAPGGSPDAVTATFREEINGTTVNGTTFTPTDPSGAPAPPQASPP